MILTEKKNVPDQSIYSDFQIIASLIQSNFAVNASAQIKVTYSVLIQKKLKSIMSHLH